MTLDDYLDFIRSHREEYRGSGTTSYVTDRASIEEYIAATGNFIGLRHVSNFNNFIVDLVRMPDGSLVSYERVIPASRGAGVAVTTYLGKFVLLIQERHIVGEIQLSFPRGFGEKDKDAEVNIRAELMQELGCTDAEISHIGRITADSGLTSGHIDVFAADIRSMDVNVGHEGIEGCVLLTAEEMNENIRAGRIDDGITISAYCIYSTRTGIIQ